MKKLISQLKDVTDYLSNLDEKCNMEYIDVSFQGKKITKLFENVAEDLAQKVVDYDYPSNVGFHPFLECDEKLSKKLGFEAITICPYVGSIHNMWLKSNFMWVKHNERDNLIIDIYYIDTNKDIDYIKGLIVQELFNFKRDAKWVIDGVYDMKMMGLKYKIEKKAGEMMKKILNDKKE